ncbi:AraC family transcriptional regulator [Paenibacillus sp. NPDC058071]|uniref:helix-turn-helix transcriptional regulator n=1 Tax=Paenibacillus sp. NPDC058071 TaxID=3346326 RepID=UPI0036DB0235
MIPTNERIVQHQFMQYQAEVIMAAYHEIAPGVSESRHEADYYRLCYITRGTAHLAIDDKELHDVVPGRLYLLQPGGRQKYTVTGSESLSAYWCHYRVSGGEKPLMHSLSLPLYIEIEDDNVVIQQFSKLIASFHSASPTGILGVQAMLLELMERYLQAGIQEDQIGLLMPDTDKWNDVLLYIDSNLHRNIQVEELAKVTFLHPNYFITSFKSLMGCSPIQYVTQRRLDEAKRLLSGTWMPIADVARKVGMLNHYLSRLFKRETGITPMQYRRIMHAFEIGERQLAHAGKGQD